MPAQVAAGSFDQCGAAVAGVVLAAREGGDVSVLSAGRLVVAGPATSAVEVAPTPGQHGCGVRFRVGAAGAALGAPVDVLRDLTVSLEDLWGQPAGATFECAGGRCADFHDGAQVFGARPLSLGHPWIPSRGEQPCC